MRMNNMGTRTDHKEGRGSRVHAIIVAAGAGQRAGQVGGKKQFIEIADQPVIIHTLNRFQAAPVIDAIICVVAKEDIPIFSDLIKRHPLSKIKQIVAGGACRQDSVSAGLSLLETTGSLDDLVVVHDGVRPLVSTDLIERVVQAAGQFGGAVAALPVTDSLKIVSQDLMIQKSVPRESVWAMQTPQAFRLGLLIEAMKKAALDHYVGTDEASLFERSGHPVFCVEGDHENIKITTASDLKRVETLLGSVTRRV